MQSFIERNLPIVFGCIGVVALGSIIMKIKLDRTKELLDQFCKKLNYYDRRFRTDLDKITHPSDLDKITHPCDILIAIKQRDEYFSLLRCSFSAKKTCMDYTETDIDIFERRVRAILDKQYMIYEYFGHIRNLETGHYLEIILNTEWQKEAAMFFFDNGMDYIGLPNIYELAIVRGSDYSLLKVRRKD